MKNNFVENISILKVEICYKLKKIVLRVLVYWLTFWSTTMLQLYIKLFKNLFFLLIIISWQRIDCRRNILMPGGRHHLGQIDRQDKKNGKSRHPLICWHLYFYLLFNIYLYLDILYFSSLRITFDFILHTHQETSEQRIFGEQDTRHMGYRDHEHFWCFL